jgi:hypothetical protein
MWAWATRGGRREAGDEGRATRGGRRGAGDEGRATNGGHHGGRPKAGDETAGDGGGSHGTSIRLEWEHGQPADAIRRAIVQNVAAGVGHYSPGRTIYHHQLARGSAGERIATLTHLYCRKRSELIVSSRRDFTASRPVDSPDRDRRTGRWVCQHDVGKADRPDHSLETRR